MRYRLCLNWFSGLLVVLLMHSAALALQREFPANSVQVKIEAINDPYIKASGKTYQMPPGMLIFSANNMTIVRGALTAGVMARIQLDLNGDLHRIWILNPEEVVSSSSLRPATNPGPTEKLQ